MDDGVISTAVRPPEVTLPHTTVSENIPRCASNLKTGDEDWRCAGCAGCGVPDCSAGCRPAQSTGAAQRAPQRGGTGEEGNAQQ